MEREVGRDEVVQLDLGALVQQIRSSTNPGDLPPASRFVGLESIEANDGGFLELSTTSEVRSRVFHFQPEDVLYGRLRPYQRKCAIASFEGFASGEVIVLRCSPQILPRFLQMILLSENFTRFVNARTKGDRPRASFATISSYRIELPSLEAQDEICARNSRLHDAVKRLEEASEAVDRVTDAIMSQTRSKLIWDSVQGNRLVPLIDIVESIDYGTSQKSTYDASGSPVLRIPNISSTGRIDAADLKYSPLSPRELERSRLEYGDILLVRSNGSLALVGRAAQVDEAHAGFAFAGYLLRIHPKEGVSSAFLLQIVRSVPFQRLVATASRSSTGINNLSAGRLANFEVPLVGTERQNRVVDILGRLDHLVTSTTATLRHAWTSGRVLHETARNGWLGQPGPATLQESKSGKVVPTSPGTKSTTEGRLMTGDIQTNLLEQLDGIPSGIATFESLFREMSDDYDATRDVIFGLLAADPPVLMQVFDPISRSIVLRRAK